MLKRLHLLTHPQQWPRDTRDTLFLLAVIALVLLPQAGQVPLWCSGLSVAVLLWRATLALRQQALPSRAWLVGLLLMAMALTWWSHQSLLGQSAGVTLIVVLLALKTLELRARRDAFVVFFLGFFVLLTHFFHSQSLLTALGMLLALFGLLTALVLAHMPVGQPPLREAARTAGVMVLLGTPIMVLLFLLFPRLSPLWNSPADPQQGRSGLSGSMQVGRVAELALDDSIALRIRFDGPVPPAQDLYFRGPVLSTFDGHDWLLLQSDFPRALRAPANLAVFGTPVRYEVTQEVSRQPWLLVLDATPQAPAVPGYQVGMGADLQWFIQPAAAEVLRYRAESYTTFRHGPLQAMTQLQDYVALPPGYNPRTLALAAQMRQDPLLAQADASTLTEAVLQRLRSGGYRYTLEPGVYGQHSADEFWFDRKAGFCEHITSAYVILMRALDVPARIVTGYQGGDRNPLDGYWAVRQSDAHAWAEVWQAGRGWLRVDPTAAVAPSRVQVLRRLAPPAGVLGALGGLAQGARDFGKPLRAAWEALNNAWTQRVLNYSRAQQFKLLQNLGFPSPDWQDLGLVLSAAFTVTLLGGLAAAAAWNRGWRQDPWLVLLARARQRLARSGLAHAQHLSPRQLAQALQARDGVRSQGVQQWLLALEAQRYARTQPGSLAALRRAYKGLPWPA